MHQSNHFCSNCDNFIQEGELCSLNPVHIPVKPTHFCAQWDNRSAPKFHGAPTKLTDRELYEWIVNESTGDEKRSVMIRAAAAKFGCHAKTVEDRLNKLQANGYINYVRDQKRTLVVPAMNKTQTNFRTWEEPDKEAKVDGVPERRRITLRKWHFEHILPAFRENPEAPKSYSQIAKAAEAMGRAAFNRLIKDGMEQHLLVKLPDTGLYQLTVAGQEKLKVWTASSPA